MRVLKLFNNTVLLNICRFYSGRWLNVVSSAGGANFMDQNKRGNLDYKVIEGTRTNQSNYRNIVEIVGLYEFT